jgi:Pentapeptide repeats (8 copies)
MAKGNPLRQRWLSPDGATLAEDVTARLVGGRSIKELGLDVHEGRLDLRYLPLPAPQRLKRFETLGWFVEELGDLVTLRDAHLGGIDFSGAELSNLRCFGVAIDDCLFEGAVCRDWRLWNSVITDSSFGGANMRSSVIGSWDHGLRNEWWRINFARSDLRGTVLRAAVFEDCDFTEAKLRKLVFEQCAFRRCRFAGPLREVVFDGREVTGRATPEPLVELDFTGSTFDEVEFRGYRLDQVALPDDPSLKCVTNYRSVVEQALARLDGDDSRPARMLVGEFQNRLRMMRGADEDNVFNLRDYRNSGGPELAELANHLIAGGRAQ